MKRLLKDGYKAARRPSQHQISTQFRRDNGGAIPPNLLTLPNTRSNDDYFKKCRAAGLPIHPARFPPGIPDFFIRYLTQEGQLVVDPFAGSNVTGQVAEQLGRSWISVEINADYVAGSRLRFGEASISYAPLPDSLAG
jgi:site-specific DNA-methyltransferase (cytosine-N4-specific)